MADAYSPLPTPESEQVAKRFRKNQAIVLVVTFLTYASFHLSRRPTAIVKSSLHPARNSSDPGWGPFNSTNFGRDRELVGSLDSVFLFAYAGGMFVSGHIGDRFNLRRFLFIGMLGSGTFCILFGMAHVWNIQSLWYFVTVQVLAGLFQSSGWPSVVAVVGAWFGKGNRGLIMGIWNSHTSVGNILGSIIGGEALRVGWWYVFFIEGSIIAVMAFVVLAFLPVSPEEIGLPSPHKPKGLDQHTSIDKKQDYGSTSEANEIQALSGAFPSHEDFETAGLTTALQPAGGNAAQAPHALSICEACNIPGVVNFALCLFFCKLVAYTFLFWLPFYLHHIFPHMPNTQASDYSSVMDVGGIVGGILAGYISDRFQASATVSCVFLVFSAGAMLIYRLYGDHSVELNLCLMFVLGIFVNGPYALITTAVSADLGTHKSLKGNANALATVTAIIDGTGSLGAAIGPLLTGFISATGSVEDEGWNNVFYMLIAMALIAAVMLLHLVSREITSMAERPSDVDVRKSVPAIIQSFEGDGV